MGTWLDYEGPAGEESLRSSELLFQSIRDSELLLSTWRTDTELARINSGRTDWKRSVLFPELDRVLLWSGRLNGAFHAGLGKWILASRIREGKVDASALARLNRVKRIPRQPSDPDWVWEEGGFGKGLALDKAAEAVGASGKPPHEWSLNFGGQILHRGAGRRTVAIAHPQKRSSEMGRLWIQNESIATSGQAENPGHLLDPRSGKIVPDEGSATVIHPSALIADIAATALAVLGPKKTQEWWTRVSSQPEFAGLQWVWVERSGRVTASAGLRERWWDAPPEVLWVGPDHARN
jgi:thiamine biosynthesis lipoprotein ApbE